MKPIGLLMIEHRLIERMIKIMRNEADSVEQNGKVDVTFIDKAVDFIKIYADRCQNDSNIFKHILLKYQDELYFVDSRIRF